MYSSLLPMMLALVLSPYRGVTKPLAELWGRYRKGPHVGARRLMNFTIGGDKQSLWSRLLRGERGSFTIPNEADVGTSSLQAEVDKVDFDIVAAGFDDTGVRSGCAVTERAAGGPAMFVDVAVGQVVVAGSVVAVTAGTVTVTAADATNPRFDLVVANSGGTKAVTAGTPAVRPVFPAIPANSAVFAAVLVEASTTDITDADITDKRVIVRDPGGSVFNVLDFGAVGDGTTDDTSACQDALDAADTAGGGLVYFPRGEYRLTTVDLDVFTGTVCRGDGPLSIVRQETAAVNAFTLDPGGDRIGIMQMTIQADSGASKAGAAVRVNNNRECFVSDVWIDGRDQQVDRWQFGLDIHDVAGVSRLLFFQNFYIQSISADASSAGIHIDRDMIGGWGLNFLGGIVQTSTTTADVAYTTPGKYGLWIESVDGAHFSDIEIIDFDEPVVISQNHSLIFDAVTNTKFKSVSVEVAGTGNPAMLISVTNGGQAGVIQNVEFWGCTFFGNATGDGVRITDLHSTSFIHELSFADCSFNSNSGAGNALDISNSGGGANCRGFSFSNCQFSDAADGVEINDDVTAAQFTGCQFHNVTTAFDINGSDNKELSIVACNAATVGGDAVTTGVDFAGYTGSYHDIEIQGNTPNSLFGQTSPLYLPTGVEVHDEFISGLLTTGNIGSLGWGLVVTGGGSLVALAGIVDHPGIIQLSSGAGVGDQAVIYSYAAARTTGPVDADTDFDMTWIARLVGSISNAVVAIGLVMDPNVITTPADCYRFHVTNASAVINANVRSAGVDRLNTTTGVTWVTNVWHTFRIRRKGANIDFWVDGVLTNTHTGTKPTVQLQPTFGVRAADAFDRDLDVDYFSARLVGLDR